MPTPPRRALLLTSVVLLVIGSSTGCATTLCIVEEVTGDPPGFLNPGFVPFSGTGTDLVCLLFAVSEPRLVIFLPLVLADLPLSLAADVALLPFSAANAIGRSRRRGRRVAPDPSPQAPPPRARPPPGAHPWDCACSGCASGIARRGPDHGRRCLCSRCRGPRVGR